MTVSLVTYGYHMFAMFLAGNLFMLAFLLWFKDKFIDGKK